LYFPSYVFAVDMGLTLGNTSGDIQYVVTLIRKEPPVSVTWALNNITEKENGENRTNRSFVVWIFHQILIHSF